MSTRSTLAIVMACVLTTAHVPSHSQISPGLYLVPPSPGVGVNRQLPMQVVRVSGLDLSLSPLNRPRIAILNSLVIVRLRNRNSRPKRDSHWKERRDGSDSCASHQGTARPTQTLNATVSVGVPVSGIQGTSALSLLSSCSTTITVRPRAADGTLLDDRRVMWQSSQSSVVSIRPLVRNGVLTVTPSATSASNIFGRTVVLDALQAGSPFLPPQARA